MKQQQFAQSSTYIHLGSSVGLRYIFCSPPPFCKWWRRERGEGSDQAATGWHAKGRSGGVARAGPTWGTSAASAVAVSSCLRMTESHRPCLGHVGSLAESLYLAVLVPEDTSSCSSRVCRLYHGQRQRRVEQSWFIVFNHIKWHQLT